MQFLVIAAAAACYFLVVFATGALLGPVRVLWLEPRLGPLVAVLYEAPVLLLSMFLAATWITRRFSLQDRVVVLVAMGTLALVLQLGADFAVGLFARSMTIAEQVMAFLKPAGLVYLALLAVFAAMPTLVGLRSATMKPEA